MPESKQMIGRRRARERREQRARIVEAGRLRLSVLAPDPAPDAVRRIACEAFQAGWWASDGNNPDDCETESMTQIQRGILAAVDAAYHQGLNAAAHEREERKRS